MLRIALWFSIMGWMTTCASAQNLVIESPDGTVDVTLHTQGTLSYSVSLDGREVIAESVLQMELSDETMLGDQVTLVSSRINSINETWTPAVGRKSQVVHQANQVTLSLKDSDKEFVWTLQMQVANDGVAFRYGFPEAWPLTIREEHTQFNFTVDANCWPAFLNSYTTEHQALYPKETLSGIFPGDILGVPLTLQLANDCYMSITEAALTDWAGLYLILPTESAQLASTPEFTPGQLVPLKVDLPSGTQTLKIAVDDCGGNGFDHVDLVDAKLFKADGSFIWLSDLKPASARQAWGSLKVDKSVEGNPLRVAGQTFAKGLGTHASAGLIYHLPEGVVALSVKAGLDDEAEPRGKARVAVYALKTQASDRFTLQSALSRLDGQADAVKIDTCHSSPWRVIMLGRNPVDLVNSDLVLNLNEPCCIADTSWIKPGVSSWNWLSCGNDMDNALLKGFIDLSAAMQWDYTLIDDGWYSNGDCTKAIGKVDVPMLAAYAKERGVKLWLWVHWQALDRNMEKALALYEQWGIAGVKTDFMSRDDQWMVNWYRRVLDTSAKHKLMIDFHGCYKPTGIRRTWPNLMTREAIYGNEQNLGSRQNDPVHKITLPFTRGLAGPMDYTPGLFTNQTRDTFRPGRPVPTQGTRCQELAVLLAYDSPYLCMGDKPSNYYNEKGLEFLKHLPSTWDNTIALDGRIGQYYLIARQKGNKWYVGGMTDWTARDMTVTLDFLDAGQYEMVLYKDGPKAGTTDATDLIKETRRVMAGDTIKIPMASGGGFVAILTHK